MMEAGRLARRVAHQLGCSYCVCAAFNAHPSKPPLGVLTLTRKLDCSGMEPAGVTESGVIAYNIRSTLVLICGLMTAQRYVHGIMLPHVLSFMQWLPEANFQQDKARPNTARVSQAYLRTVTTPP
ncbi:transposable element Tcb2 transposase [Trichonephila clavipes]|nr:transposable element Tcb2 transposase [Trichonephila clavipes]